MGNQETAATGSAPRRLSRTAKCLRIGGSLLVMLGLGEAALRITGYEKFGRANLELYAADSVTGYRMRANVDVTSHGCRVQTNRSGLRGHHWEDAQSKGQGTVLFSGHSIAFGFGVDESEAYPSLFTAQNRGELVGINFGHCAMRYDQELPIMMAAIDDARPVAIHVMMTGNDFEPRWMPFGDLSVNAPQSPDGSSASTEEAGRIPIPGKAWLREHSLVYTFLRKRWSRALRMVGVRELPKAPVYERLGGTSQETQRDWASFEGHLARLVETAQVPVALSVFPMGHNQATIARARDIAGRLGITWIGIDGLWEDQADYLRHGVLSWDSHPNPASHRAMAEIITEGVMAMLEDH